MSRITNKHIIKIKELISDEVCMGTFGLVELELLEIEKAFSDQLQNTSSNSEYKQCKNCTEKSCPGGVSFCIEKDYMYFKS